MRVYEIVVMEIILPLITLFNKWRVRLLTENLIKSNGLFSHYICYCLFPVVLTLPKEQRYIDSILYDVGRCNNFLSVKRWLLQSSILYYYNILLCMLHTKFDIMQLSLSLSLSLSLWVISTGIEPLRVVA